MAMKMVGSTQQVALPPLRFEPVEEKLIRAIRQRVPEFGFLEIRLECRDGRLIDAIFISGEERVRLE